MGINELLQSVSPLIEKRNKKNLQLRKAGEFFNLLSVIGLKTEEIRLHSAFIAEMINPYGAHGQKDIFLKLFIRELGLKDSLISHKAKIFTEYFIGGKTAKKGGRIDILIRDKTKKVLIAIENKIYAHDGENQLYRYNNYISSKKEYTSFLFYLTLDGHNPTRKSTRQKNPGGEKPFWNNISYKDHILKWLEKSMNCVKDKSQVKVAIKQYYEIVNQILMEKLKLKVYDNGIVKKIKRAIVSASEISDNLAEAKRQIIEETIVPAIKDMAKRNQWEYDEQNSDFYKARDCGGTFFYLKKKKWKKYGILFDISTEANEGYYGIAVLKDEKVDSKIFGKIYPRWKSSGCWAKWDYLKDENSENLWLSPEWIEKIQKKRGRDEFIKIIEKKTADLIKQIEENQLDSKM
ncbi:PD-(D/E)XK nuclease family protein [Treponema sp.]|uniref:PDDEXK-like family protein n=1 Tax=Treponema sp. TaxID=166 RepID=UPI003890C2CC